MFKFKSYHPLIFVLDMNRAVAFYRDILGFKVVFQHETFFASLIHEESKMRIDLHPSEADGKDVGYGAIIYFETNNFDENYEYLISKNVKAQAPRREGDSNRFVTFFDSEGNAIGFEEI
jgi:catechol 2,3-dioxygenase-like lactoylglutathione lyase family enzyme